MFRHYYQLIKPGIIYGNVMTAAAGFLLAAGKHVDVGLFAATLAGTSLVIAAACVINNYFDRQIDAKMMRTKQRALVRGDISIRAAWAYALLLGVGGMLLLIVYVNWLVVGLGGLAFVDYVVFYGVSKRKTVHGTLVGSIAGAAPMVAGYAAVTDRLDGTALLLFLLMVGWQLPHFYAISLYRLGDYRAAAIPVLPARKSLRHTKLQIIGYIAGFTLLIGLFGLFGFTAPSPAFLIVMGLTSLWWLWLGLKGWRIASVAASGRWARQIFASSLLVVTLLSLTLPLGAWLAPGR